MTKETYALICKAAEEALLFDTSVPSNLRIAIGELYKHANEVTSDGSKFVTENATKKDIHELAKDALHHIDAIETLVAMEDIAWYSKYDLGFRLYYANLSPILLDIGLNMDYYDPDTSYRDDIEALVAKLRTHVPVLAEMVSHQKQKV